MGYFVKKTIIYRVLVLGLAAVVYAGTFDGELLFPVPAQAAGIYDGLSQPGQMLTASENFSYPILKGIRFDPQDPLKLEFIIDSSDKNSVDKEEAGRVISYFLAGLTLPEDQLWVNLSPYEQGRVIPAALSSTQLGEDMLKSDYLLKQLSASLTYPQTPAGKAYWDNVTENAQGLSKVWAMPEHATVFQHNGGAFIQSARLKVLTEDDYFALAGGSAGRGYTDAFKTHILPLLNEEVNKGRNFAVLRQIYYSLILAVWFKERFKESFYKSYINKKKVKGIDLADKDAKEKIYALYVEAFKKGAYDYLKKDIDRTRNKMVKRRYFCGGFTFARTRAATGVVDGVPDSSALQGKGFKVDMRTRPQAAAVGETSETPPKAVPKTIKPVPSKKIPYRMISPVFNEGKNLERILTRIKELGYLDRITFVNDASSDDTLEILQRWHQREGVEFIDLKRNRKKEGAILAAMEILEREGRLPERVITLDSDTYLTALGGEDFDAAVTRAIAYMDEKDWYGMSFIDEPFLADNSRLIEHLQYPGYLGMWLMNKSSAARDRIWVLAGRGVVFRSQELRDVLRKMEPDFETGDFSITVNLLNAGRKVGFYSDMKLLTTVPDTPNKLFKQRRRWERGTFKLLTWDWHNFLRADWIGVQLVMFMLFYGGIFFQIWYILINGVNTAKLTQNSSNTFMIWLLIDTIFLMFNKDVWLKAAPIKALLMLPLFSLLWIIVIMPARLAGFFDWVRYVMKGEFLKTNPVDRNLDDVKIYYGRHR